MCFGRQPVAVNSCASPPGSRQSKELEQGVLLDDPVSVLLKIVQPAEERAA